MLTRGLALIARPDALAIVLGTIPSQESLAAGEYYARNANAFWFIMGQLFGAGRDVNYQERVEILMRNRIALWDVLHSARRIGSLDSRIMRGSEVPNDFAGFFRAHRLIRTVFFNGGKAGELYKSLAVASLPSDIGLLLMRRLPSTSPANTHMVKEEKLKAWELVKGSRRIS